MEPVPWVGACQKHQPALRWGEGRSAKCPRPCLCLVGRSGRAKQSSHVPWLHRELSVASFSSLIYPVFTRLFLLPCIEARLFLYAFKNSTPLPWPGFGCLLCLFTSAFCPFHFTSSSASTGYSLPAACCISFFPRIYLCVKMHHAGLNN